METRDAFGSLPESGARTQLVSGPAQPEPTLILAWSLPMQQHEPGAQTPECEVCGEGCGDGRKWLPIPRPLAS